MNLATTVGLYENIKLFVGQGCLVIAWSYESSIIIWLNRYFTFAVPFKHVLSKRFNKFENVKMLLIRY
jgi:hypothetical protein